MAPEKAEVPKAGTSDAEDREWGENEIDAFILAKLVENGLHPSERASNETLIRRISLDLTGLPPGPEQVKEFLGDGSEADIAKAIDGFLASPSYGERMALVMARRGALCRFPRLSRRQLPYHVALARLGHPRLQRKPALR